MKRIITMLAAATTFLLPTFGWSQDGPAPIETYEFMIDHGVEDAGNKNFNGCIRWFEKAIETKTFEDNIDFGVYFNLGYCYSQRDQDGDCAKAREFFAKAEESPDEDVKTAAQAKLAEIECKADKPEVPTTFVVTFNSFPEVEISVLPRSTPEGQDPKVCTVDESSRKCQLKLTPGLYNLTARLGSTRHDKGFEVTDSDISIELKEPFRHQQETTVGVEPISDYTLSYWGAGIGGIGLVGLITTAVLINGNNADLKKEAELRDQLSPRYNGAKAQEIEGQQSMLLIGEILSLGLVAAGATLVVIDLLGEETAQLPGTKANEPGASNLKLKFGPGSAWIEWNY